MCPFCGESIEYAGISSSYIFPEINTAQMYICRKCGYQGSFIIEVDNPEEVDTMKEALNKHNEGIKTPIFRYPDKWRWFYKVMLIFIIASIIIGIISSL
jgi:ABC-type lipoprotein release transport system permease subunit